MSYRPEIKINAQGGTTDFPLDAETVKGVDVVNTKQDTLVSGTNIKTINNESLLGSGNISISGGDTLVEKTYAELKALRDNGTLVAGTQYRITDYQCTTITTNTSSANHQFDIIVVADSTSKLNENARAILHTGDTYFASNKLESWILKYCIDNDTTRFEWADSTNGKGVIYYMKDEFDNECPYDFKNMLFTMSGKYTTSFTFTRTQSVTKYDSSLGGYSVYSNIMKPYIVSNKMKLPFNVFYAPTNTGGTNNNVFEDNCYNNTLSYNCGCNLFQRGSYGNTFSNACNYNVIGYGSSSITFGNYCSYNRFMGNSSIITLGSSCTGNLFDKVCNSISLTKECSGNVFKEQCASITLGRACYGNYFDYYCTSITLGAYSNYNYFKAKCIQIKFGSYCVSNVFGIECKYVIFGSNSSTAIGYCKNITVDDGCSYLIINSTDTTESSSNYLQNVNIHKGIIGPSSNNRLEITVPDRALAYTTDYYKDGSKEVLL